MPVASVKFLISGMDCATCTKILENALKGEPGVRDVVANYVLDVAVVEYEPTETDEKRLRKAAEAKTRYRLRRLR
jgi:copper chaperone CopZ